MVVGMETTTAILDKAKTGRPRLFHLGNDNLTHYLCGKPRPKGGTFRPTIPPDGVPCAGCRSEYARLFGVSK